MGNKKKDTTITSKNKKETFSFKINFQAPEKTTSPCEVIDFTSPYTTVCISCHSVSIINKSMFLATAEDLEQPK